MAGGRPSDFTPELALLICTRIAGGASLRKICRDEDMPHRDTVHAWLVTKTEFSDQYARAREAQADGYFDEMLEIADNTDHDYKLVEGKDGGPEIEVVDHEHISRSKLRVDTRKWIASKLAPKKYGERVALTGPNGGAIQTEDKTPAASKDQVLDDLRDIFGAAAVSAGAAVFDRETATVSASAVADGAAVGAAAVADGTPAQDAAGDDRVVRERSKRGRSKKPGAPTAS